MSLLFDRTIFVRFKPLLFFRLKYLNNAEIFCLTPLRWSNNFLLLAFMFYIYDRVMVTVCLRYFSIEEILLLKARILLLNVRVNMRLRQVFSSIHAIHWKSEVSIIPTREGSTVMWENLNRCHVFNKTSVSRVSLIWHPIIWCKL